MWELNSVRFISLQDELRALSQQVALSVSRAALVAGIHALGKPSGGQFAGDLGAVQPDGGDQGPGQRLAGARFRQRIDTGVERSVVKVQAIAAFQCLADGADIHAEVIRHGAHGAFGFAGLVHGRAWLEQVSVT